MAANESIYVMVYHGSFNIRKVTDATIKAFLRGLPERT